MRVKTTDSREIKACGHPCHQCNILRLYVVININFILLGPSNLHLTLPDCFSFSVPYI